MIQEIRLIKASDSITDLTLLIRRAYKALADMGLNYTGAYQDETITLERIKESECYVMVDHGALIATITLHLRSRYHVGRNSWYARPEVAVCGQFAVEPKRQREGLGSKLMEFVERRAVELGARELALDTAEQAEHLVRFYTKRNYRFIDFIQHKGKTYRSVILSKAL